MIPSADELELLSDETASRVLETIDRGSKRRYGYAMLGMAGGILGLLGSTAAFTYLVHDGHPTEAYIILGTNVIGLLVQMVKARLDS